MTKENLSQTESSLPNITVPLSNEQDITVTRNIGNYVLTLQQRILSVRTQTTIVPENELQNVPEDHILQIEPLPDIKVNAYPIAAPVEATEEEFRTWQEKKVSWETTEFQKRRAILEERARKGLKQVTLKVPIVHTVEACLNQKPLQIYHTLRGPVLGQILSEGDDHAVLYSPCFLDPNIQSGKIHYFPIAFAGHAFTVYYATCMGKSVPQEVEAMGYPHFIERNKAGDYAFHSKAAYHHIDADYDTHTNIISATQGVRTPYFGLIPTSDTSELRLIHHAREQVRLRENKHVS